MEFSVLGALSVRADGEGLAIRGAKPRALLSLLLVHANRVVATDRLIEDLWDGNPPESAAGTLQNHISAVRKVLGRERLGTRGGGYVLQVAEDELDVTIFENELAAGQQALGAGETSVAVETLKRALGRWRGSALGEFATAAWALGEAARLEELRRTARPDRPPR